jgi:hypothetical protein
MPLTRIIRGLQNIRTHSGTSSQVSEPYKAFLRIGSLEMEKARRGKEKESAMLRVQNIDSRFRDIDAEKEELLESMGLGAVGNGKSDPATGPKPSNGAKRDGFKFNY